MVFFKRGLFIFGRYHSQNRNIDLCVSDRNSLTHNDHRETTNRGTFQIGENIPFFFFGTVIVLCEEKCLSTISVFENLYYT